MENYYIVQSKNLDVRPNNGQVVEYIPVEDMSPKTQAGEFSLADLWRRIMQRKWLFLGVALSIILLSIVITIGTNPTYRASTTLQIGAEDSRLLMPNPVGSIKSPLNEKDYYQTQFELLRSRSLAKRTIDQLGIESQFKQTGSSLKMKLYTWLSSLKEGVTGTGLPEQKSNSMEDNFLANLIVQPVENSQIFKISFNAAKPEDAANIVNTLAESYIVMNLERRAEAQSYAKTFLADQLQSAKKQLVDAENHLVDYAKKEGIITTDDKESLTSQSITEINRAYADAQAERITAEAAYRNSQNVAGASQALGNATLQALKGQLATLQGQYLEKSQLFKPAFPEMQQLSKQISELKSEIARESSNIDVTMRSSLKAVYMAALQKEKNLQKELDKQKAALLNQRDRSVEYNTLQREVEANRQNYEGLLQRLKEVSIAEGSGSSNVLVVDKASVPSQPYKPNIMLNLGVGVIAGILLGLLAAILADVLDERVLSVADMKRISAPFPLLGVVPYISGKKNRNILAYAGRDKNGSFMLEAFRSLRENILLTRSSPSGEVFVVNVTSPSSGEGKTTTSINLATVFAYSGKRVLLVDADMRHPEIHNKLNLSDDIGLGNYLLGDNNIADVMQESGVENLSIVTAGAFVFNPTELLASDRFMMFLNQAGQLFDLIVIDSPPVMGLADALILSNRSNNTLLVSAVGQTEKRNLRDTCDRLNQARSNVLGTILTKIKSAEVSKKYYGYPNRYPGKSVLVR